MKRKIKFKPIIVIVLSTILITFAIIQLVNTINYHKTYKYKFMKIGYYKEDVILWLDDKLDDYADKKVVILQHYPIVAPIKKETHYTYKADEYLKLLTEHKNVKALIAGHFGVNKEEFVDGILHISTKNAPVYRVIDILDYETENPTFWSTIKE